MQSSVSISMVDDLARRVGISIKRLAPSWGWFTTAPDGKKVKFAQNNGDAYSQLETLLAEMAPPAKEKEKKLWSCMDSLGLTFPAIKDRKSTAFPAMAICATSRAAAIRMLDKHFGCGKGTGLPSFEYRVKKYWKTGWPLHMQQMAVKEVGIWNAGDLKKVA